MRDRVTRTLCTLLLSSTACSSSMLVRHDDASFLHAQARLERVASIVEAEAAATSTERRLFLQAESFYQYRFEPPPRTAGSYLAQAAAVTFDFPALQALAGSMDLLELRLRTYDGAVQLWETLLSRHPNTALRPLVLYRLGWAYRNSGAVGFPRESGDEAFALLVREHPSSPLAALAKHARDAQWKSRDKATSLSIVPGLGQFYVGERLSGGVRLAIALAAVALVVAPTVVAYQRRDELSFQDDWPLLATGLGGVILLSIDYTTAYQDALRGVVEWNERAEAAFQARHPDAP
jgi:hypothetical protein